MHEGDMDTMKITTGNEMKEFNEALAEMHKGSLADGPR